MAEPNTLSSLSYFKRQLLSGGAWSAGGRMISVPTVLITNVLLARLLPPEQMGTYFLAFTLVMFGATAGTLGLNQAVVRLIAENMALSRPGRVQSLVRVILVLGLLGASGVGLAYLLLGGTLARHFFHAPILGATTGLVAVWMVLMSLQMLLAETHRGFHDIRSATVFSGLFPAILLAACLALVWMVKGQAELSSVMILTISSISVSVLLASWLLFHRMSLIPKGEQNQTVLSEVLRITWPMLGTTLTWLAITQMDIWIVSAYRPQDEVALYGAAARTVLFVSMSLLIINAVVQPLIAQMYAERRQRELERVLRIVATLATIPALLVTTGFIVLGGPVLGLLFGDYYREAASILALLSFGHLVAVWAGPCSYALSMTGYQTKLMKIAVATLLITLVAQLIAASHFGAVGVAIAASGGIVIQSVLILVTAKRETGMWTHFTLNGVVAVLKAVKGRACRI